MKPRHEPQARRGRHPFTFIALLVVAMVAALATGCGDDGTDGNGEAQPATDDTSLVSGRFGDIPLPPLADPVGPETVLDDGSVVRSFTVRNRTVQATMSFYESWLAQRPVVEPVTNLAEPGAPPTLRGEWQFDNQRLRVTVQPAPTVEGDAGERNVDQVVQLSLQLFDG